MATIDNEGVACTPAETCALCGGAGSVIHRDLRDRLFGAPGVWSIRRCDDPGCGLGWLEPMPEAAELPKFYASYYTHGAGEAEPVLADPPGDGGVKQTVRRALAALLPSRSAQFRSGLCHLEDMAPGKLLEIGCGDGAFLRTASRAGWQAHGIDFDESAVAAARRIPGVSADVGDLLAMGYAEASFDAVVLNNVIEHLPDTREAMREIHRILRPDGRVVMVTPNLDAIGHDIFGPDWRGLEIPRHLYLFTARTLARYAREAGFARVAAFSPIGGGGTDFMVEASRMIAERAGRTPPVANARAMRWRGRLGAIVGVSRCEWVVLAATR